MRDLVLKNIPEKRYTIYYHVVAWVVFICYEVTLSAAIRGSYNHYSDYLFHYPLYIILFYVHCFIILADLSVKTVIDFVKLSLFLGLELAVYYGLNVLINNYLAASGWEVNVIDPSSRLFHLGTFYRFLYIAGLSTGFRIALNLLASQRRNIEYLTETLTHQKEKESLKAELLNSELSFLRSQINPHFLFNSLNSVYNRIRKNDPNSAEYVMALADLMQYALKPQAATEEVPVEDELDHISNYFKLQQMRYSAHIDLKIFNEDRELKIIPLLLISLVENVFQHGDLNRADIPPIIEISVLDGQLNLQTSNYTRTDPRRGNGVGLTNTRKRLELHYPGRYSLEYGADKNIFKLKLHLNLK
ncbi:sensor histidine kinase [Daejeonella lutea]|uniref:Histidine kinase n=1 Tax=Daejeonella lutea TaxID=572036 RepID=A0A1T5AZ33_9SPHI|nr:histidine kinase [Daejeonella lutea]SKB40224.1 Histidine kinase [Daejeonella lutea]